MFDNNCENNWIIGNGENFTFVSINEYRNNSLAWLLFLMNNRRRQKKDRDVTIGWIMRKNWAVGDFMLIFPKKNT